MKIKDMTDQQIFDAVVEHAAKQYERAIVPIAGHPFGGACKYRAANGTKCFVGALIDDTDYMSAMENRRIYDMLFDDIRDTTQISLLGALQQIHDGKPVHDWIPQLLVTGEKFKLDTSNVIPKFKEYNRPC